MNIMFHNLNAKIDGIYQLHLIQIEGIKPLKLVGQI